MRLQKYKDSLKACFENICMFKHFNMARSLKRSKEEKWTFVLSKRPYTMMVIAAQYSLVLVRKCSCGSVCGSELCQKWIEKVFKLKQV